MSSTRKDARWQTAYDMLLAVKVDYEFLDYGEFRAVLDAAQAVNNRKGAQWEDAQAKRWNEETE